MLTEERFFQPCIFGLLVFEARVYNELLTRSLGLFHNVLISQTERRVCKMMDC